MRTKRKGDRDVRVGEPKISYDDMREPEVKTSDDDLALIISQNPTQLSQLVNNPIWKYMVRHTEKIDVNLVNALIACKTQDNSMFIRGAIDTVREYKRLMQDLIKINVPK